MKRAVVFLEQQSWRGGAQRVLEATLDSVATEYDCIVTFPDHGPFRSRLEEKDIRTMDLPIGQYSAGKKSWLEMARFVCRSLYCGLLLAMFIRRRQVALVYINGPRCLPAGVLAGWLTGRPAILHLHLILDRKLETVLVRSLSRYLARVVACSRAAAASLLRSDPMLSSKTRIVYNPYPQLTSPPEASNGSVSDSFTIGIVGRVTESKRHHLLFRAVAGCSARLRDRIRILVVGSGAPGSKADLDYLDRLRADAVRFGLEKQIIWTGYQAELGPYYASMDVLVHPSVSEAMSIVILEALHSGIPVIANRAGGNCEVVRDGSNGLLTTPEDDLALERAITLFFENRMVQERLLAGARAGLDRRFSPATFSSEMRSSIGELCAPTSTADASVAAVGTGKG